MGAGEAGGAVCARRTSVVAVTPRTLRRFERALSIAVIVAAVVFVAGLHRLARLERHPPAQPPWVRLRIDYGTPGPYFLGVALGPTYPSRRQCLRALPTGGYETIGHTTTVRQFECIRIAG